MKKVFSFIGQTFKVFILFTGCTILFYYGMMWLQQEYEEYRQYDEPQGTAIQVSKIDEETSNWIDNIFNRMIFFYYNGE